MSSFLGQIVKAKSKMRRIESVTNRDRGIPAVAGRMPSQEPLGVGVVNPRHLPDAPGRGQRSGKIGVEIETLALGVVKKDMLLVTARNLVRTSQLHPNLELDRLTPREEKGMIAPSALATPRCQAVLDGGLCPGTFLSRWEKTRPEEAGSSSQAPLSTRCFRSGPSGFERIRPVAKRRPDLYDQFTRFP